MLLLLLLEGTPFSFEEDDDDEEEPVVDPRLRNMVNSSIHVAHFSDSTRYEN